MTGKRPFVIGLTGSIGMGKSTTSAMFAELGIPVWDADATVHQLYQSGETGAVAIAEIVPVAVGTNGVDREVLKREIAKLPDLLQQIEGVIHPLVQAHRKQFIKTAESDIVLCDIPLLLETGSQDAFDCVVVVTASAEIQKARVLDRPGMTEAHFASILSRQMPDAEKRQKADYLVDTSTGLQDAQEQVAKILTDIRSKLNA